MVPERTQPGVDVVQIARAVEVACVVAAQVVTTRRHGAEAVSERTVCHDTVLQRRRPGNPAASPAITAVHEVIVDRAVADGECALAAAGDAPTIRVVIAVVSIAAGCGVCRERAAVDRQMSTYLRDAAASDFAACKPDGGPIAVKGAAVQGKRTSIADAATKDCLIVGDRAAVDGQPPKTIVEDAAATARRKKTTTTSGISAHGAVVNRQIPLVYDAASGFRGAISNREL